MAACHADSSARKTACAEFTGKYVTPQEDGRTWFDVRQQGCDSVTILTTFDGVAGRSADTMTVTLGGGAHLLRGALLEGSIIGDTLRVTMRTISGRDTAFSQRQEWTRRVNGDLCFRETTSDLKTFAFVAARYTGADEDAAADRSEAAKGC